MESSPRFVRTTTPSTFTISPRSKLRRSSPIGLGHVVDAAEKLDVGRGVAHHEEHDFALATLGHNTAADFHDVLGVFAGREVGILRDDVAHVVGHFGVLGIRIHATSDVVFALGKTQRTFVVEQLRGQWCFRYRSFENLFVSRCGDEQKHSIAGQATSAKGRRLYVAFAPNIKGQRTIPCPFRWRVGIIAFAPAAQRGRFV